MFFVMLWYAWLKSFDMFRRSEAAGFLCCYLICADSTASHFCRDWRVMTMTKRQQQGRQKVCSSRLWFHDSRDDANDIELQDSMMILYISWSHAICSFVISQWRNAKHLLLQFSIFLLNWHLSMDGVTLFLLEVFCELSLRNWTPTARDCNSHDAPVCEDNRFGIWCDFSSLTYVFTPDYLK